MTIYSIIENIDQKKNRYDSDSVTEFVLKRKTLSAIHRLYHDLDLTVRDICYLYDFEYHPGYQKLFYQVFGPKGKRHGGRRRGNSKFANKEKK